MKRRVMSLLFLVILGLIGAGYWYYQSQPQPLASSPVLAELALGPAAAQDGVIKASGYVEVRQVEVAPEVSGRLARLLVDESDLVSAGQTLAAIDTRLLDAQVGEAEAALTLAEAQLDRVEAGLRAEEIAVARAAVTMTVAQREATYSAWQDAILLRDNPQELDLQIAAARSQVDVLEHRIEQMVALKDAAESMSQLRERQVQLIESGVTVDVEIPGVGQQPYHYDFFEGEKRQAWAAWNLATTDVWTAWVRLEQTIASRDTARQQLADLLAMREDPQEAEVKVAQAEAAYQQAVAAEEVARAKLALALAGPSPEQIEVARNGVQQAQAALDTLRVLYDKYELESPIDGIVLERARREGEIAQPGKPVVVLASLDSVELTVYVPEPDMGAIFVGQPVDVTVDTFPGKTFAGQVTWIANEAEFTPRNVQTREDRLNTVFAVKVSIPNPDHRLKPGMPADAVFVSER